MSKSARTYTEIKNELDQVVSALQKEDLDVEEALTLYEQGQQLIKELENYLQQAENKVIELKAKFAK